MKKVIILIIFVIFSNLIFASSITVKGVTFTIKYLTIYPEYIKNYRVTYLTNDLSNIKNNVEIKLTRELNKYPKQVLLNYVSKTFNIVKSLLNLKTDELVDGLWYNNNNGGGIILMYSVFNSIDDYDLHVLHHEIFHSIYAKGGENSYNLLKTLNNFCNYSKDYNLESTNCLEFKSEFLTTYHPNGIEVSCETFSLLMQNDSSYDSTVIDWYLSNKSNNNKKLKENIKAVISFTDKISNGVMNEVYYFTISDK